MLRTLLTLLLLSLSTASFASEDLFQKGLAAYQNRKYDEARAEFEKIAESGPVTARLLHNLALTYYQLNQKPHALALWRKALAIDPTFRAARTGRELLEGRFNMRPFERDSLSAWLRQSMEFISFFEALWVIAALLSLCGWLWIRYLAERRAALDEERPLPPFPTAAVASVVLLLVALGLGGLKASYTFTPRATVVTDSASLRSLPAEDGVGLAELPGGSEVLVRRSDDGWTQVQNSEGATGWVKNAEILVTTGR